MKLKDSEIELLKKTINSILHKDQSISVYLFGSRVSETSSKYSDVDILIDATPDFTLSQLSKLKEDIEESSTPFIYDFVLNKDVYEHYSDNIEKNKVLLFSLIGSKY